MRLGATDGTTLGFGTGVGAVVGGALTLTDTICEGALVGTTGSSGAGLTANTACVGTGFGARLFCGAGVGFGGALGLNFESSCRANGRAAATRGFETGCCFGTTGACGSGGTIFCCVTATARCGVSRDTVMMALPAIDSGEDSSDDDVATENSNAASSA